MTRRSIVLVLLLTATVAAAAVVLRHPCNREPEPEKPAVG